MSKTNSIKEFITRLLAISYLIISVFVFGAAIVLPFAMGFEDSPPLWTCFLIYSLTLVLIASQPQVISYINKKNVLN
jgi:hypothetical protein